MTARKSRSKFTFEKFQNDEDKIFAVSKYKYTEDEADKLYRQRFKSREFKKVPGYVRNEYFTFKDGSQGLTSVVHYPVKELPCKTCVPCFVYIYK